MFVSSSCVGAFNLFLGGTSGFGINQEFQELFLVFGSAHVGIGVILAVFEVLRRCAWLSIEIFMLFVSEQLDLEILVTSDKFSQVISSTFGSGIWCTCCGIGGTYTYKFSLHMLFAWFLLRCGNVVVFYGLKQDHRTALLWYYAFGGIHCRR